MRFLLSIVLAGCLSAAAQPDASGKLESLLAQAQQAQAGGDYRAAAAAYREAVSLRPDTAELWSNLGLMQYESHDYARAGESLRRALALNRSLAVPNLFLGLDLLELKRPHEAVAYLLAAQRLNPQDTQTLLALGRSFHLLFDPLHSREWYRRAADLAPRNGEAWFGLGVAYLDSAESASAKVVALYPGSPYVAQLTAEGLAAQGHLSEAIQHFRELLDSTQQLPPCARYSYASLLLRHGDRGQAEEQFQRDRGSCPTGIRADAMPQSPTAFDLERLAGGAFFSGDFAAAAHAAERLEQQYPRHPAGWYWAVRAYQQLGVAALTRAGEVEPDSPRMHALLGDTYQRGRMFREAEQEYLKMLARDPNSVSGLAGLAAAYLHDGQLDDANAVAVKALARDPSDSEVNLLMAEILVARHRYADAEPYLDRSMHARPDLLPRVHALRGRVLARTGQTKKAINELRQGLPSDEDGSVYYQLARLYQSSGDEKAAAAAFEKSQQIRAKRGVAAQETLAQKNK